MLSPPGPMVRHFGIPKEVVRDAYRNDLAKEEIRNCVAKIRDLAAELEILTPASRQVWRALGIWDDPRPRTARKTA
jgi:hypothetical protein